MTSANDKQTALDVWLRFESPDDEETTYEANTFKEVDADGAETFRVDWYHVDVGQVTSVPFSSYEQAKAWLEAAGYQDFSS
jgi:hypothetical protein